MFENNPGHYTNGFGPDLVEWDGRVSRGDRLQQ